MTQEQHFLLYINIPYSAMRLSIYSYIFPNASHFYLYNSENSVLAEISELLYSQLYNRDFSSISQETFNSLKEKRIIVEENEAYLFYHKVKMQFLSNAYNKEAISLVIVPYTGCNFACPYCFEEKKNPALITEEIEDGIISFLSTHPSAKDIDLTWYGGEPLIAFKNIKSLYTKIKNETTLNIGNHSIVTNGYLINSEILDFFKETHLRSMQITLDGIQEHHDQTRYLKHSKKGTFNKIIENIHLVTEKLPDCHLSVRVNVDKNNADDFVIMLNDLYSHFDSPNFKVYPGFIREETKDKCSLCYQSIKADETVHFYETLKEKGANVNFFPAKANKGCMINKLNSYIIGPNGEIYKCWNDVSNPDKIVGNILEKEISNKILMSRYMMAVSPFEDYRCKECLLFPICSGGCGWYRYKNLFEKGEFDVCCQYRNKRDLETALINSLEKTSSNQKEIQI